MIMFYLLLQVVSSVEITRIVSFENNVTQRDAICGETIRNRLWISINAEPGTERTIALQFESNEIWAQIKASSWEFINEIVWTEYVKRIDLKVPLDLTLKVPGCEPNTNIVISITGTYQGGICDKENTDCILSLPDSAISITTETPRMGTLITPSFNVIRGKWTKPIKLMIPHKLLTPETLNIEPKSLLLNALQFKSSLIKSAEMNPLQFTYTHPYFPKRTYMYVKAKNDLALSQKLEIEYKMKCIQCKFNQFPEKIDQMYPVIVAESSKQQFTPLYIPTMKTQHKYCFTLSLNRKPITEITVVFELCQTMIIEPREVTFSKIKDINDSTHQTFCITPIEESECQLKFYLNGDSIHDYIKPNAIKVYAKESDPLQILVPSIIEVTNRIISTPQILKFQSNGYADVILTPFQSETDFFKFQPESFIIESEIMQTNEIEFFVTANVECPMSIEEMNMTMYYIINWKVNGSLGDYMKPTLMYIKVIANMDELSPFETWCPQQIDCTHPTIGQTCFIDKCILNSSHSDCTPLIVRIKEKESGLTVYQYIMIGCICFVILIMIIRFCGCFDRKEEEETTDSDEDSEEKRIFNTEKNFEEAQVAIENLLWRLYEYEKNLDANRKYEKDIFRKNYYDD